MSLQPMAGGSPARRPPTLSRAARVARWVRAAALALAGVALLGGCALPGGLSSGLLQRSQPQFRDGKLLQRPADLPQQAQVHGVPFYADDTNACGPASLAEVLRFAGVDTDVDRLKPQLITPALDGTLQYDMLGATRRAGRIAYVLPTELGGLFGQVAAGFPVVVLQRLGLAADTWHFAVVVGYDLDHDSVTLRSSTARELTMSIESFDASWAGGGRWAFVALAPQALPHAPDELRYLEAVAPMEGVAPAAARIAYHTALRQWPQSWVAMMGLGNLAYARHDYTQAAVRFAQAARAHPDDGDPLNNLAQALASAGDFGAARSTIAQAIAIGKPNPDVYARTREQIEKAAAQARPGAAPAHSHSN